jgi:hypothetical protein
MSSYRRQFHAISTNITSVLIRPVIRPSKFFILEEQDDGMGGGGRLMAAAAVYPHVHVILLAHCEIVFVWSTGIQQSERWRVQILPTLS